MYTVLWLLKSVLLLYPWHRQVSI